MTTQTTISRQETIIKINNIELWAETFGDKNHPAIVLISGAGSQGIKWPVKFCEALAKEGYFITRFDNRDTGLSSQIDYSTNPYTLLDMAKDVIGLLDHYEIKKAHIVGASMGGAIAMLLAAHFPERVHSLNLLITTIDMKPACDLFRGIPNNHALPAPSMKVIEDIKRVMSNPPKSVEDKIQLLVEGSKLHCGKINPDEELLKELAIQTMNRTKYPENQNHFQAMVASCDLQAAAIDKITAITHVVHGDEDLIFPVEHGKATHAAIKGSTLCIIPGMGHNIASRELLVPLVENIIGTVKKAG